MTIFALEQTYDVCPMLVCTWYFICKYFEKHQVARSCIPYFQCVYVQDDIVCIDLKCETTWKDHLSHWKMTLNNVIQNCHLIIHDQCHISFVCWHFNERYISSFYSRNIDTTTTTHLMRNCFAFIFANQNKLKIIKNNFPQFFYERVEKMRLKKKTGRGCVEQKVSSILFL